MAKFNQNRRPSKFSTYKSTEPVRFTEQVKLTELEERADINMIFSRLEAKVIDINNEDLPFSEEDTFGKDSIEREKSDANKLAKKDQKTPQRIAVQNPEAREGSVASSVNSVLNRNNSILRALDESFRPFSVRLLEGGLFFYVFLSIVFMIIIEITTNSSVNQV